MPHGEGRGRDTRPAAERLTDAALEHAHADRAHAVAHERVGRDDELDVRSVPGRRVEDRLIRQLHAVELGVRGERHDDVRVADVDTDSGRATGRPFARTSTSPGSIRNSPRSTSKPRSLRVSVFTPARVPIRSPPEISASPVSVR